MQCGRKRHHHEWPALNTQTVQGFHARLVNTTNIVLLFCHEPFIATQSYICICIPSTNNINTVSARHRHTPHLVGEAGSEHLMQRRQLCLLFPQRLFLQPCQRVGSSVALGICLLASLSLKQLLLQHTPHDALILKHHPVVCVCLAGVGPMESVEESGEQL